MEVALLAAGTGRGVKSGQDAIFSASLSFQADRHALKKNGRRGDCFVNQNISDPDPKLLITVPDPQIEN